METTGLGAIEQEGAGGHGSSGNEVRQLDEEAAMSSKLPGFLHVVEDERASVSESDFRGLPGGAGALVPESGRFPWGFVIVGWNQGADDFPRWFDGLEAFETVFCEITRFFARF